MILGRIYWQKIICSRSCKPNHQASDLKFSHTAKFCFMGGLTFLHEKIRDFGH